MATVIPWWRTGWVAVPIYAAAGLTGVLVGALRAPAAPPSPPLCPGIGPEGGRLEGVDYTERRSGGAEANAALPMLVVLHGGGMTDLQMAELARAIPFKVRIIAPRGFYPDQGGGFLWRDPEHVVNFDEDVGGLASFLEQVRRCRPTHGLPVLAGYDQGADVVYQVAADDPALVAAVVGAGGEPPTGPVRAPTVALHGVNDEVVEFARIHNEWHERIARREPVKFLRMFGVDHSFAGALQIKLWQESTRLLADPSSRPTANPYTSSADLHRDLYGTTTHPMDPSHPRWRRPGAHWPDPTTTWPTRA